MKTPDSQPNHHQGEGSHKDFGRRTPGGGMWVCWHIGQLLTFLFLAIPHHFTMFYARS
jgi:hypothetical protein